MKHALLRNRFPFTIFTSSVPNEWEGAGQNKLQNNKSPRLLFTNKLIKKGLTFLQKTIQKHYTRAPTTKLVYVR